MNKMKKKLKHPLILAPLEGVGDICFRKAIASIGGFDEAVTPFLSVPKNAHTKSLAKAYNSNEIAPIPLTAQILGNDPILMAQMAFDLEQRKAPKIDINFGCPSNTVNAREAGSFLLQKPEKIYQITKAVFNSIHIPLSVKMRAGYKDKTLFQENLLAAQEAGASAITLHPRLKSDFYENRANWDLIAKAKEILKIKVIGNGDITTKEDALKMILETKCDALMIGRGALQNPFIFQEIKAFFQGENYHTSFQELANYLISYVSYFPSSLKDQIKINKVKQIFSYLCLNYEILNEKRMIILKDKEVFFDKFFKKALTLLSPK